MSTIYRITEPTDEVPAVIISFMPDSHNGDGNWLSDVLHDMTQIFDQQSMPIFNIIDADNMHINLDDLIHAAKAIFIDSPMFHHANFREAILVSKNLMYSLAAKGLNTPIFGNVKMKTVTNLQEALDYVRQAVPAK